MPPLAIFHFVRPVADVPFQAARARGRQAGCRQSIFIDDEAKFLMS